MLTFQLATHSNVPAYVQLGHQVREALSSGVLRPGDRLPTVKEVVQSLAINPNTVLKAYRELERDGLVEGRQGSALSRCAARTGLRRPSARPCPARSRAGWSRPGRRDSTTRRSRAWCGRPCFWAARRQSRECPSHRMLAGRFVRACRRAYGGSAIASLGGRHAGQRPTARRFVAVVDPLYRGTARGARRGRRRTPSAVGPMEYAARGTVLLLPPSSGNPFVSARRLEGLGDVLTQDMTSTRMRARLRADGMQSRYTVSSDFRSSGPLIEISAIGPTRRQTNIDVQRVITQLPIVLARLQTAAGLTPDAWIRTLVIVAPRSATPLPRAWKIFGTHWS